MILDPAKGFCTNILMERRQTNSVDPLPQAALKFVQADASRPLSDMPAREVDACLRAANRRDRQAWARLQTRQDWERFRDARLKALRDSLGAFPPDHVPLEQTVTRTHAGERHFVDNLIFRSRTGLWITANLYRPAEPCQAMPGILICHSQHSPKSHGELQDMGMTWARLGCLVLVMDQLGHGERRQQPFGGREDYHSRYVIGMQLHLVGESLTL